MSASSSSSVSVSLSQRMTQTHPRRLSFVACWKASSRSLPHPAAAAAARSRSSSVSSVALVVISPRVSFRTNSQLLRSAVRFRTGSFAGGSSLGVSLWMTCSVVRGAAS
ncbi:hypothetical protein ACFQER_05090 [Halomicroarcula sp. GCM10025894]|uniref:hypothetical protein n=1 Tax=Halomicroarcula sp. GCM10025894 TaxID=3252673 RepID=UPI003622D19A